MIIIASAHNNSLSNTGALSTTEIAILYHQYMPIYWKPCHQYYTQYGKWQWYNFRWPLVTPNPCFKVTGYLKVEYLADCATVFNCTKHSCRAPWALPKTCIKTGGRRWKFCARRAEIFLPSLRRWLYCVWRRLVANTLTTRHLWYLAVQQLRLINDKHARVLTNCLLPLMSTILLILTAMNSIVKLWRAVFKGIYFTRYIRRSNKLFKWLNWYRACFERRRPRVRFYFFSYFYFISFN